MILLLITNRYMLQNYKNEAWFWIFKAFPSIYFETRRLFLAKIKKPRLNLAKVSENGGICWMVLVGANRWHKVATFSVPGAGLRTPTAGARM